MAALNVAATASSSPLSLPPIEMQSSAAAGRHHNQQHHHHHHHSQHHQPHSSAALHAAAVGLHVSHHTASNSSSAGVMSTSMSSVLTSASLGRSTPRSPPLLASSSSSLGSSIVPPPPPPPLMSGLRPGAFSMSGTPLSGMTTPPLSIRSGHHQTVGHSLSMHSRTALPLGLHHHHHHFVEKQQQQHQQSSSSAAVPFCFHHSGGSSTGGGLVGSAGGPIGGGGPGATASSTVDNNACRLIEYRGAQVAAFQVDGRELICLPQAFDLFLKHLVGGLHTVYTKLKRLDITPVVCNVEQVRVLRGLGAIQPGVNRCKLISPREFDVLYDDCTNSSARPGRPPKRTSSMSTAEVALEHLKQSKLSGFSDFYSQSRLLADAKKALTGFAASPNAAAAAVSGFLPYLDFKKSPLFAAAAAAAAAAGCYGYQPTAHQQGHHHPQHLGGIAGAPSLPPPPMPPPPPPVPQAIPPTSLATHLAPPLHPGAAASFLPFGTAAYHAGMMSLAASMHAAHQLQRRQQASLRRDGSGSEDAMSPHQQRHQAMYGRNGMALPRDAKPEPEEVNVDDEDEVENGRRVAVIRGGSPLRRSRSTENVNRMNRAADDIYNNNNNNNSNNVGNGNIGRGQHLLLPGGHLPHSHFLSAVPYHLMQGSALDAAGDKPLNLETTFRHRTSSSIGKRSESSSSIDSCRRAPRQAADIDVDDVDDDGMPNDDDVNDRMERCDDRYTNLKRSPAHSIQSACDSYIATSYSEDGKQSRSRSCSLSRSVDDEDGDQRTRLADDDQVANGQRVPTDGDTSQVNGRWPLIGADLLRDHRIVLPLTTTPASTCVVQASSAPESTMTAVGAVRATGVVDAGGFSIESLLSNVQGLLKAVVDGARRREHQADIERAMLRKELKREKENRRQLERRLSSAIDRFADVADTTRSGPGSGVGSDRSRRADDEQRRRSDFDVDSDLDDGDNDGDDDDDDRLRLEDLERHGLPPPPPPPPHGRANGISIITNSSPDGTIGRCREDTGSMTSSLIKDP